MSDVSLVPAGNDRAVLQGLTLPAKPPARIYIGDAQYRIVAPTISLPPVPQVVKAVLNWTGPAANVAKNVFHIFCPSGFSLSNATNLLNLANAVHSALSSGTPIPASVSQSWHMNNVTVSDLSGSGAKAVSTVPFVAGNDPASALSPQVSVCISWEAGSTWKGGKLRTYLPGIPTDAVQSVGSSQVTSTYAIQLAQEALSFMNNIDALTVASLTGFTLGSVSYYSGHAVRPTPIFRDFIGARVHERLDSQRRRSGKESAFGSTP